MTVFLKPLFLSLGPLLEGSPSSCRQTSGYRLPFSPRNYQIVRKLIQAGKIAVCRRFHVVEESLIDAN